MLSLPRDLKASPTCTATGKINEVYWCNNMNGDAEEDGANALMKEIGNILGIEFQYFAHINWGSLVSIVDTLGGIHVTLDEDIQDYGGTHAVFDAGVDYTINGEQALGLARARYGTMLGDFSRGNSQQKILIGIKDRIYEKNISFTDALSLVSTLGDNLRTNLSVNEIKTAIHLTFEFDFDSMRQLPLIDYDKDINYMTFATVNGISYVVPSAGIGNYSVIREYVKVNLNNDPVIREQARIMILNGSERVGVAADERDNLRTEQFNVVGADNAPEGTYPENYAIYFTDKAFNGTVQALEKRYNTVAHEAFPDGFDTSSYDILIIIGGDTVETPAEETVE
jgi:LCP family protein required for cell wall assembly